MRDDATVGIRPGEEVMYVEIMGNPVTIHTTPDGERRAMAGILRGAARSIVWAEALTHADDQIVAALDGPWPDERDADWARRELDAVISLFAHIEDPVARLRAAADHLDPERRALGRPVRFPWEA